MIKPEGKQGWPEKDAGNAAKVNMIERCPELLGQPRGAGKSLFPLCDNFNVIEIS